MQLLKSCFLTLVLFVSAISAAQAVNPDEILQDAVLEKRARNLSAEIRCMVCQNQSIDDSDASVAKDLRLLVRERLVAGDSDEQVLDYLVDRFGEFVLLKPRFSLTNALLWLTPLLALIIGFLIVYHLLKKGRETRSDDINTRKNASKLDKNEQKALEKILKEKR